MITATHDAGARGDAVVTGTGSMWRIGSSGLFLGGSTSSAIGTGTLTIGPGATVEVNDSVKLWEDPSNTLTFIIAGHEFGSDYGHLEIGGELDLSGQQGQAGTLEIILDDFPPSGGESFDLFEFGMIVGEFAIVDLPPLPGELFWDTSDLYTHGIVRIGPDQRCYANCDGSTSEPILTVDDFTCFINAFAEAQGLPVQEQIEHYANCDGSTTEPVLTVDDFTCFINAFTQGCP